ncbi:MAG: hypothetical protein H0U57_11035 [Tatlockia sp.]|nr:hypothetical protein [Tatlockia sp.]
MSRKKDSYFPIDPLVEQPKHTFPFKLELAKEWKTDAFKLILEESFTLCDPLPIKNNFSLSRQILTHLANLKVRLGKHTSHQHLARMLENLMTTISGSSNDADAMQKAMEYLVHLPVVHLQSSDIVSLGSFLAVSEPVMKINDGSIKQPFRDSNVLYLKELFKDLIKFYRNVDHQWHFSYPQNSNGEIMTEKLAEWQAGLMIKNSNNAHRDFERNLTIDGHPGFKCSLISVESTPEKNVLEKMLSYTEGACILSIKNPNEIYFISKSNKTYLEKIELDSANCLTWNQTSTSTNPIDLSYEEFTRISEQSNALATKIIEENISTFCDQLSVSANHKKMFADWLNRSGGQEVNRFVDFSLLEKHFGEEQFAIFRAQSLIQNWVMRNNKPTFFYAVGIKTIIGSDSKEFCKFNDRQFIQQIPSEFISNYDEKLSDILRINAEVELNIVKNNLGEMVVKPSLVKYEITSPHNLTDSGRILLNSPEKNSKIMSQLRSKNNNIGQSSYSLNF